MNIALFLSGGTGIRMGTEIPKQYIRVSGRPVFSYSLATLFTHPEIHNVQIVAAAMWQDEIRRWGEKTAGKSLWNEKFRGFSRPGDNRQMSIYHGLEDIRAYAKDMDWIFVHDAARPMLSAKQIEDCLAGAAGHEGAMPVLPMKDTVYYSRDGRRVERLLERGAIYGGQAPETFLLGRYYEANRRLMPVEILNINGSTEPAVIAGMDIAMICGDEGNFKVTTRADLERFQKIVEEKQANGRQEGDVG